MMSISENFTEFCPLELIDPINKRGAGSPSPADLIVYPVPDPNSFTVRTRASLQLHSRYELELAYSFTGSTNWSQPTVTQSIRTGASLQFHGQYEAELTYSYTVST